MAGGKMMGLLITWDHPSSILAYGPAGIGVLVEVGGKNLLVSARGTWTLRAEKHPMGVNNAPFKILKEVELPGQIFFKAQDVAEAQDSLDKEAEGFRKFLEGNV